MLSLVVARSSKCLPPLTEHSWAQRIFYPTKNTRINLESLTRGKALTKACGKLRITLESNSQATRWVDNFRETKSETQIRRVWLPSRADVSSHASVAGVILKSAQEITTVSRLICLNERWPFVISYWASVQQKPTACTEGFGNVPFKSPGSTNPGETWLKWLRNCPLEGGSRRKSQVIVIVQ